MTAAAITRDGQAITGIQAGITNYGLVGIIGGRTRWWFKSGRFRMDDKDHPLDIVEMDTSRDIEDFVFDGVVYRRRS